MKHRSSSLLCLGIVGASLALLTSGGSPRVVAQDKPVSELDQPFVVNGYKWKTKAEFLQHGRCGTPEPTAKEITAVNARLQGTAEPLRAPGFKFINVYVHIITGEDEEGNVVGEVSDAQINDQMAILNQSFAGELLPAPGMRPPERPTADTPFRFRLVSIDRTHNPAWYDMSFPAAEQAAKTALRRGTAKDLNMYFCGLGGGLLGFATFPSSYASSPFLDGVVMLNETLPGGSAAPFNLGGTVTHEVGHWMGLFHTFQGGCSGSISAGGDGVGDTAPQRRPFFGTPPPYPDTCRQPGRDPVENFMDYSDDIVYTQFTNGQVSRMNKMMLAYRGL
jgi:hypothetical protein